MGERKDWGAADCNDNSIKIPQAKVDVCKTHMLPNQPKSRKSPTFRHDPRFYALMNFSVPSADRFFLSSKVTTYNPGRKLKGGGL